MEIITNNKEYHSLLGQIAETYEQGQRKAIVAVNNALVETYWHIGRHIVEFEQGGATKAEYGKGLLAKLSKDLALSLGKGFSVSNLTRMRQFYVVFPIYAELPHKLSWSHWVELLKIDDPLERSFYLQQTQHENWSTTELIRQKQASLFLRLAASKDKAGILQLAQQGQTLQKPADLIREPYVLDFLKIPEPYHLSKTELEKRKSRLRGRRTNEYVPRIL